MDQSGNNHLLLRASQSGPPGYNGQHVATDRMRELLARTVHDHIMEERSTAAALQDIRQRLDALDGATPEPYAVRRGLPATIRGWTVDGERGLLEWHIPEVGGFICCEQSSTDLLFTAARPERETILSTRSSGQVNVIGQPINAGFRLGVRFNNDRWQQLLYESDG